MRVPFRRNAILTFLAVGAGQATAVAGAWACGCFAPQNIAVPVVQAGERIAFAQRGDQVEMHVQILYSGEPTAFAWILPVPEIPELDVGSDPMFQLLLNQTQPIYRLNQNLDAGTCGNPRNLNAGGGEAADFGAPPQSDESAAPDPVLARELVGAFESTVVDASDKQVLLDWLRDNGFTVADDENDPVIDQYVGPGRMFLTLKLQAGAEAGDIQPIVLKFSAGAPSIPIKLTRVGAEPDMPVVVWVLGDARAIPQNYRHTLLNPEHIDWFTSGSNYIDVVTAAVDEAPEAHSFVTEFSGPTEPLRDRLAPEWRFGARSEFQDIQDAQTFVSRLQEHGFAFDVLLQAILRGHIPYPEVYGTEGVSADQFYADLPFYLLSTFARDVLGPTPLAMDGAAAADEVWERVVLPARNAERLFQDFPTMTRLFTTLSPHEMTEDPVFAFNPDLPAVDRVRQADFTLVCDSDGRVTGMGWLELPDGRRFYTRNDLWSERGVDDVPFSSQIQALGLEGAPRVEVDNRDVLTPSDPASLGPGGNDGCQSVPPSSLLLWTLLSTGVATGLRRRRRG